MVEPIGTIMQINNLRQPYQTLLIWECTYSPELFIFQNRSTGEYKCCFTIFIIYIVTLPIKALQEIIALK